MDKNWAKTFSLVSKLLIDNQIEHVFIKTLVDPFEMTDIDVLIPHAPEELRALDLLQKEGFKPQRAGKLLHPLKIICVKENAPSVDIHPDAEWNRKKVCNGKDITARRVLSNVRGVKAYLPPPEDSFYLTATHAYAQHSKIERKEVLTGIWLISQPAFSWGHLYNLTKNFGTFDAIYTFLLAIKLEANDAIKLDILNVFSKPKICRFVDVWLKSIKEPKLPLLVPPWLSCVLSSFAHTPALVGKAKAEEVVFDFLSHYMHLVGGE